MHVWAPLLQGADQTQERKEEEWDIALRRLGLRAWGRGVAGVPVQGGAAEPPCSQGKGCSPSIPSAPQRAYGSKISSPAELG